jgi:hypothetical protein
MSTPQEQFDALESAIPELKKAYREKMYAFLSLPQSGIKVEAVRHALLEWHQTAVDYFNAFERSISLAALVGADKDPTWYTERAETAANLLGVIVMHFKAVGEKAEDLSIPREQFRPSIGAFASMQRLVRRHNAGVAREIRTQFASSGLPTHGFDTDETNKPEANPGYSPALWEKIVGVGAAVLVLMTALYVVLRNERFSDPNQVVVLRIVISFSVATLGAVIPGFLHVGFSRKGLALRAGGALALFIVTFFFTPAVLPSPSAENSSQVFQLQ